MKLSLKQLLSSVLSISTLASAMPLTPVFAEDAKENYPYTLFASSDVEGAITIDADNFVINGEIATNGTVVCGDNNSINTNKNEQICAEMVYIPNRIEKDFFSGFFVKKIEGNYDLEETNININSPLSVGGITELTGNVNIQSGIKSKDDIIISGDVENSANTVIYSQYGNIEIDCNNVNLNGLIYAPFGNVHIKASNLNMNNTMIIADTITIEAPSVNVNYSERFGKYFGEVSDKMKISEEDYQYFNDENENGIPDFFEKSINWKYLTDTDGDGVPDIIEINMGSDPELAEDDYNEVLDSYTLELMYKNPLILYKPETQESIIYGDMYHDQRIDVFDLVLLKRACINGEFYEEGDLDGDGDLDIDDVKYLQDFLLTRIKCYPVYDRFDTDNDGLSDYVEIQFIGTSSRLADTDGDGLSDYFEVYLSGTDPNIADENTSIDSDGDGLTMLQESEYKTNPYAADTDNDGLSDYDEVITYGTDPLNADSDGDGLTDKEEVIDLKDNKLDPNNPATNGTPDGERIFTQIISADSPVLKDVNTEDNAYNLSLIVNATGNAATSLRVVESGYSAIMKDGSAVGFIPEFLYNPEYTVQDITLKFEIKEEYRDSVLDIFTDEYDDSYDEDLIGIKRFNIFKYFEEIDAVMPIDTDYDVENNTVYVTITNNDFEVNEDGTSCGIGSYSLVDLEVWGIIMNENCNDYDEEEDEADSVQMANALPQSMYAPHVNILANGSQQVSASLHTRPIEMVEKIMRNYYAHARVNTPETFSSNVITYRGHKYSVINGSNISWSAAESACEAMGGHLMTPSSAGEFALLQNVLTHGATYNRYWLGAHKTSSGWQFVNGEGSVKYIDSVRKNVSGHSYGLNDYAHYIGDNLYYADGMSYYHNKDLSCSATGYICEWDSAAKYKKGIKRAATLADKTVIRSLSGLFILNGPLSKNSNTDTDGDGIPDYLEINLKLMNKVAPGETGVSWIQINSWLSKNKTSRGIVSGNKTSDKVNKALNKTATVTTGPAQSTGPSTAGTHPAIVTTAVMIDGRVISSDYDNDYYPDDNDDNPLEFDRTEIDMDIIDDSDMYKKIVLRTKDTTHTITASQREIMSTSCGGGVTEIMNLPENCEKAASKYKREHDRKVQYEFKTDEPTTLIVEMTFDDAATANNLYDKGGFADLNQQWGWHWDMNRMVSKEVNGNKLIYTINVDIADTFHLDFDKSLFPNNAEVKIYEDNYVYAENGGVATYSLSNSSTLGSYMRGIQIVYFTDEILANILTNHYINEGLPMGEITASFFMDKTETLKKYCYDELIYVLEKDAQLGDKYIDDIIKAAGFDGTVATFGGVICLGLEKIGGIAKASFWGGVATVVGGVTTTISIYETNQSTKQREKLGDAIWYGDGNFMVAKFPEHKADYQPWKTKHYIRKWYCYEEDGILLDISPFTTISITCLLYTTDAADDL
ncbi:MAG: hypothetical protein K2J47_00365, partial [Ruminococcus sp.]|nr:hypothetical protein [Ruminococcus sp.]